MEQKRPLKKRKKKKKNWKECKSSELKKAFDYHAKKNLSDAISMSRVTDPVFSNFTLIHDTMEMFPYHGQMHLGQYFGLYTSEMKLLFGLLH